MNILNVDESRLWTELPGPLGARHVWEALTDNFTLPISKVLSVKCAQDMCECCETRHNNGHKCPACGSEMGDLTPSCRVPHMLRMCVCGVRVVDCRRAVRGIRLSSNLDMVEDII